MSRKFVCSLTTLSRCFESNFLQDVFRLLVFKKAREKIKKEAMFSLEDKRKAIRRATRTTTRKDEWLQSLRQHLEPYLPSLVETQMKEDLSALKTNP